MALPAKARLRLASDFRSVMRSSKSVKEGRLLLKAKPNNKDVSRFGVVVSKAVSKKAVERNKVRRLLTEALLQHAAAFKTPHDVVVVVLPGFSVKTMAEAQLHITSLFAKSSP